MDYEMQTIMDSVNEEVEKRQPKKRKVNKSVKMYDGYKRDFIFDIAERELSGEEFIEQQRQLFYDEI